MTGRLFLLVLCLVLQATCHVVVASVMDEAEAVVPTKMRNLKSRIVGEYVAYCGGTLIASDVVLTAASCFIPKSRLFFAYAADAYVNATSIYESPTEYYRVASTYLPHPLHKGINSTNDVALVFLDTRVTGVTLAKINKIASSPAVGSALTTIGLGLLKSSPAVEATDLMTVSINTLTATACSKFFSIGFKSVNQICAGSTKGTCKGDSGGPLLIKGTSARTDVQVGITSYSIGACGTYPTAYTRLSQYATWITSNVCKYSKFKPSTCA
ncbi:serine-type endopeptidase [Fragilaria crotonensis]|nr:serine-type endopeptidase [Fragilaria crotonensis]